MGFLHLVGRVASQRMVCDPSLYLRNSLSYPRLDQIFWWLPERDFEAFFGSSSTTEAAIDMGFFCTW